MTTLTTYKSSLHQMVCTTKTDYWNDSSSVDELTYAIEHGAVGATSNPTIVVSVLKKEMHLWRDRIREIIVQNPTWTDARVAWKIFEEIGVHGARLLQPVYERERGKKGRLSIQTNPTFFRDTKAIVAQAVHLHSLAPNVQVKIPVTVAGIPAIEEATYHGVSINATVSFSVAQAIAVAEAIERGLNRRVAEGKDIATISPVCTIMVGRVDDWIQVLVNRDTITTSPSYLPWAGVAVMKRAYRIYQERGYRARLLAAAYRHHLHWTEFIGGDMIVSIPYEWQKRFNASALEVKERIDVLVDPEIVDALYRLFPDFRRAYDEDGMTIEEFDTYGATVRTLRGFVASYYELIALIREQFILPNPDVR